LLLVCVCWLAPRLHAAMGVPWVEPWTPPAVCEGTVFSLLAETRADVFVGSNILAHYDGVRWTQIEVPGAYAFRALRQDAAGRLWVGARGALGWVAPDAFGHLRFHTLEAERTRAGLADPGDIWSVHVRAGLTLWAAERSLLTWNGAQLREQRFAGRVRVFDAAQDKLLLYEDGAGLFWLSPEGGLTLVANSESMPETPLVWVLPGSAGPEENIVGLGDRAYVLTGDGQFRPLPKLSERLRGTVPSSATRVDGGLIAVATLKGGVVLWRDAAQREQVLPEPALQNQPVYSVAPDHAGNLLVGLADRAALLVDPAHAAVFPRQPEDSSAVVKILVDDSGVELVTARGLTRLSGPARSGVGPPNFAGLRDALAGNGELWLAGVGGLWRASDGKLESVYGSPGEVLLISPSRKRPGSLLFIENYRPRLLEMGPYGPVAHDLCADLPDTPCSLLEDEAGDVWISTLYAGVFRFQWQMDDERRQPRLALRAHYRAGTGWPGAPRRPRLIAMGTQVFAHATDGILALNREGTAFERSQVFAGFEAVASAPDPANPQGAAYWLVRARRESMGNAPYGLLHVQVDAGAECVWRGLTVPGLDALRAPIGLAVQPGPDAVLWVAEPERIIRTALATTETPRSGAGALGLPPALAVSGLVRNGQPVPIAEGVVRLTAGRDNLEIRVRAQSVSIPNSLVIETQLVAEERDGAETPRSIGADVRYENLSAGRYRFVARAIDRYGVAGVPATLVLAVVPPWFAHPAAWAAYAAAAIGALWLWFRLRARVLARKNERLARLVAERTRELELSNTAKSEFLENVSHEVRNPLNGLTGLLRLLRGAELSPQARGLAQSIQACADQLARVSDEVLGYSKLEYGHVELQSVPFSALQLMRELRDGFSAGMKPREVPIQLIVPDDFSDGFEGDQGKIRTVLSNFLGNALKHAPGAPVEIAVDATEGSAGNVDLTFEVTDQGPGVPAEEQELIFQKFVRGSAAKASKVPGTGLGLATCRVLAQAMNGSVGIETPPRGATFYLRVPVRRVPLPPTAADPTPAPPPPPERRRVLIVEDEAYNRTVLAGMLQELGSNVHLAATPTEARQILATQAIDLVFLDWQLDRVGETTEALAKEIRATQQAAAPVVIATTAHDSEDVRRRCAAAGMDGFLLKPFGPDELRACLEGATRAQQNEEPSCPADPGPNQSPLRADVFATYAAAKGLSRPQAIRDYIRAVQTEIDVLETAFSRSDRATVAGAAHRLRALAGLTGAVQLNQLVADIQLHGTGAGARLEPAWVAELKTAWERERFALEQSLSPEDA
jgi:signal transduction histidine kinase/CheY-like chemotaxis protein